MSAPVKIIITAETAAAAAQLQAFVAQANSGLQQMQAGAAATSEGIRGMSYYFRSGIDSIRYAAAGGGARAGFYAMDEAVRGLLASGMKLSSLVPIIGGVLAAAGAGYLVWHEWTEGEREVEQKAKDIAEAFKGLIPLLKQINGLRQAGLLSEASGSEYADYLTGKTKLYKTPEGQITSSPTSTGAEYYKAAGIPVQPGADLPPVPNVAASQQEIQKWVQDQITAGGTLSKEQTEYFAKGAELVKKVNEEELSAGEKAKAEIHDKYEKLREEINQTLEAMKAKFGDLNFANTPQVKLLQSALTKTYADEQTDVAAKQAELAKQTSDKLAKAEEEAARRTIEAYKKVGEEKKKQDESDKKHEEELKKQIEMQAEIARGNIEANIKGIEENPLLTRDEKQRQLVPQYSSLYGLNQGRIDHLEGQASVAAGKGDTTGQLEAQKEMVRLKEQQAQLENQIFTSEQQSGNFQQRWAFNWQTNLTQVKNQWGDLSTSLSNGAFKIMQQGVQGVSNAIAGLILGTKSAGQAFAQLGASLLENFISTILEAVIYAEIAIPILTALGVVSGGATAEAGAAATSTAIMTTLSVVSGLAAGGPYVAGRPYIVGEEGPELMIPDHNGVVIPNGATKSLLSGAGQRSAGAPAGGVAPEVKVQSVIVNDRQELYQYLTGSDAEHIIVQHVFNNKLRIGIPT